MTNLNIKDIVRKTLETTKEYIDAVAEEKQDKLTYKENAVKTHKLEINGRQEDVLVAGTMPCYIFELVGLIPDHYSTVKMKLHEIPEPSSLISEGEPVKLYDIPMNIDANESSFEIDYENNFFIYKLPVTILSREITGFSVDILLLTTEEKNFSAPSIDFIIFDKLMYDENNLPYFLEDKSFFSVGNEYFSSLIEYVEIIPSEDFKVNDEFLETHRFVTEEEKQKWDNKADKSELFSGDYNDLENKPCYIEENAEVVSTFKLNTEEYSTFYTLVSDCYDRNYNMLNINYHINGMYFIQITNKYIPSEDLVGHNYKKFNDEENSVFTEDMIIADFSGLGIEETPEGLYCIPGGSYSGGIPLGLYGISPESTDLISSMLYAEVTEGLWYLVDGGYNGDEGYEDIYNELDIALPFKYIEFLETKDSYYHTLDERFIPDTIVRQKGLEEALKDKSNRGHHHNDMYYEQNEIDDMITTINTALDGKAAKEHGSHLEFDSELPEPPSTNGYIGTSKYASRADHRHPSQTNITGNAGTASKLKNGVVVTIGNEAIVFDGSEPITFSLENMGATTPDYVNTKVSELVDSAPETLDTLNELAEALGDDPNFATTVANQIGLKADKTELNNVVESINEINTELETKASTEFVNTMLGGLRLVQMTQSEYDALPEKDSSTLYIII